MAKAQAPSSLYTDAQIIAATGLPLDGLRRLITWGGVKPAQSGGGRGRVRLWTTRQALRISVTAQFWSAGYSLQMAHTLSYCVPLDSTLGLYDPELLVTIIPEESGIKLPSRSTAGLLFDLLTKTPQPDDWWDAEAYPGSVHIIDGRYLYSEAPKKGWGRTAEIDLDRQRVVPFSNPGAAKVYDPFFKKELVSDLSQIDRTSLLIDAKHLTAKATKSEAEWNAPITVLPDQLICKSTLSINLALGFIICVRKLRGLTAEYRPMPFKSQRGVRDKK